MSGNIGIVFPFDSDEIAMAPDMCEAEDLDVPNGSFVLCRDLDGNPTAVYEDDRWNFEPYSLGVEGGAILNFGTLLKFKGVTKSHISEAKYIAFCLIYYLDSGHTGRLAVSTLYGYFSQIRNAVKFCGSMESNPLIKSMSLKELLTNKIYLAALIREYSGVAAFNKKFPPLLKHLGSLGKDALGYKPLARGALDFEKVVDHEQHPLIPTKIYLQIINVLSDLLDKMEMYDTALSEFIREFKDPYYGLSHERQKALGVGGRRFHRPDFEEAVKKYGMGEFFTGIFSCKDRAQIGAVVRTMQLVCKHVIHLYTGMRNQEAMRLPYKCTLDETFRLGDGGGSSKVVNLISTTTKFEGYRKEVSWLASAESLRAVKIARSIAKAIGDVCNEHDEENLMLFPNSTVMSRVVKNKRLSYAKFGYDVRNSRFGSLLPTIDESDFSELRASDPDRDFDRDERFSVGSIWPLSSHQYRRSLAFYAANSGFVSLPTLKKQFKHLTKLMTQYYQKGFQNIQTIFGFYDQEEGEFILPSSHVAFDFQTGISIDVAHQIVHELVGSESTLFGGTGSYMEKQKKRIAEGDVSIDIIREETRRLVERGELNYRETLLGGCTKLGECDSFMLADYTECLSCDGSVLKSDNINRQIELTRTEMTMLDPETGEYEVLKYELDRLSHFKKTKIDIVEIS